MSKAIYAFSGDPITFGHIDVVTRAARVFSELVVAIGTNPDKKYTFDLTEREDMARKSLAHLGNVKVTSFTGTLVDFAYENSISLIIKGVRNAKDFEYELDLHQIGESQKLGIDTFLVPAGQDKIHISSSAVKALQKEQGLVHEYVPLYVKQKLEKRMSDQIIIGVTGEIGVGKSFVSEQLVTLAEKNAASAGRERIEAHNIELDHIGHQILGELTDPVYKNLRGEIIELFSLEEIKSESKFIDRKELGDIVFNDEEKLNKLNAILHEPILIRLRKELRGKKGLILLNAALIAETGIGYLCNNNVILVSAEKEIQRQRLKGRGLSEGQIERRLETQFNADQKRKILSEEIEKTGQGKIWEIDSSGEFDLSFLLNEFKDF